jgi:hypothetical protein
MLNRIPDARYIKSKQAKFASNQSIRFFMPAQGF